MPVSENDKQTPLPAPVSLTLEEAMQVAGGGGLFHVPLGLSASSLAHPVLVNGLSPDFWITGLKSAGGQAF